MALIPQEPKQQRALVGIILAVALGYVFYQYWYTPRTAELQTVLDRVERIETANRQARVLVARGGAQDLEVQNALYERHVQRLELLIPQSQEVPDLIRTINQEGQRANVTIQEMTPAAAQPDEHYVVEAWQLGAIGEYHDVARFLTTIASLERIITPTGMDIGLLPAQQQTEFRYDSPVFATFRIETYVLPEPSGPPPADVGTGGGA